MKDVFGLACMILAIICIVGAVDYGLWLIHPVFGIFAIGVELFALGETILDS